MNLRNKCLIALTLLGILGIGPFPTTTLLGFYVVLARPRWFKELVLRLYDEDQDEQP